MNPDKKLLWLFLLPVIALSFLTSCKEQKKASPAAGMSPLQVKVFILKPQLFQDRFIVNANVIPFEETDLKAPVSGNVLSIHFKEGEKVKQGQPLVQIDDRIWKARLKGLKAQLDIAKSDSARNEALIDVQGVSQETVDKSNAQIKELQAQIEEMEVNISLACVKAPFSGRVGMRDFSVGAYLSQGMTITTLVQSDRLKVDFNVPGRYLDYIRDGQMVKLVYQADTLEATVYAIDPQIDINSRTFRVRCVMPNPGEKYVPGIFVEVIIPVNSDDKALVVPTAAIIPALNSQTVYVFHNGIAFRKEVELGPRTDLQVQVQKGLNPGDTIIMTGLLEIKDNMPVVIRDILKSPGT
jgi:membrane fusion protein (multidrug efflux system)